MRKEVFFLTLAKFFILLYDSDFGQSFEIKDCGSAVTVERVNFHFSRKSADNDRREL